MFIVLDSFLDLIILIVVIVVVLKGVSKDDKSTKDDSVRTFHRPGHDKDW